MAYKKILVLLILAVFIVGWSNLSQKKITILYSSDAHANLYPCDCKKQEDGGLARRYTLIQQIQKENPNTILLEGGSFFAGGSYDESKVNPELDKIRTDYYLKCLGLMKYDCLFLGEDEFSFGDSFLNSKIKDSQIPFVCTNIADPLIQRYVLKTVDGVNIAFLNLCKKAENPSFNFEDWKSSLREAINKLKDKEKADVLILASRLDEATNIQILEEFRDINLILAAFDYSHPQTFKKVGASLLVWPVFEGRQVTRVDLFISPVNKVNNFRVKNIRLDEKLKNSFEIAKIIPRCFSNKDCRQAGLIGVCENPGTMEAHCVYTEPLDLTITVIKPKRCYTCQIPQALENLKQVVGGAFKVDYLEENTFPGRRLIDTFEIKMLPAYVASKDIEKSPLFDKIKQGLVLKDDKYLITPSAIGASYFVGRRPISGKLDLFVFSRDPNSYHIFSLAKDLSEKLKEKFDIHFIVFKDEKGNFLSPAKPEEVEEDLRMVCIQKYYPQEFWDYCLARAKNINSAYWDDTAKFLGIDAEKIKTLAKGPEGRKLLEENIKLTQELDIGTSGTFLLNNQEIFGLTQETKVEDIQKVLDKEGK